MKQLEAIKWLQALKSASLQLLEQISAIEEHTPVEELETNDGPGRWNTIQVLEHLNSYYRFYIPQMEMRIEASKRPAKKYFTPGWLGGFFTKSMLPKNGVVTNKMKAMKNHSPEPGQDAEKVMTEFLRWQRKLIHLLQLAESHDISGIRIPISITPFIRLKLGDAFAFIVAHNDRHWIQVEKLLGRYHSSFKLLTGLASAALID